MSTGWENGSRVPVYDPREDEEEDEDLEPVRPEPAALVVVRRLVGFMLADTNPALGVECMALVTSIGYEGDSMADIARRHKCTRAAVSKRCVELCEAFGIHPPRAMRQEQNRFHCVNARVIENQELDDPANDYYRDQPAANKPRVHQVKIRQRSLIKS